MSAEDILRADGHTTGGRCEKCWSIAAMRYAGGQGAYSSHTEAYHAVMAEAQEDAERRAHPQPQEPRE